MEVRGHFFLDSGESLKDVAQRAEEARSLDLLRLEVLSFFLTDWAIEDNGELAENPGEISQDHTEWRRRLEGLVSSSCPHLTVLLSFKFTFHFCCER